VKSKFYDNWKKRFTKDPAPKFEKYDASGVFTTTSTGSPSSGYWATGTSTSSPTGYFFSGSSYGWSELATVDINGISIATGHNIRADSNYNQLAGIGLVCDTCVINVRAPWANTYGERVQVVGNLMLEILRRHAYHKEWFPE
jgi:hypothetical protein